MDKAKCSRRQLLKYGAVMAAVITVAWPARKYQIKGLSSTPDDNGLLLPAGCRSRIIARSGYQVENSSYVWHPAPDGGGVLPREDGGWIYLSNSEKGKG